MPRLNGDRPRCPTVRAVLRSIRSTDRASCSVPSSQPVSTAGSPVIRIEPQASPILWWRKCCRWPPQSCKFLEQEAAAKTLRPVKGSDGADDPYGCVECSQKSIARPSVWCCLIAPSNYPLFLPGVQALQALAAGNSVLWKPALRRRECRSRICSSVILARCRSFLRQRTCRCWTRPTSRVGAGEAIRAGVDKVFLTGHAEHRPSGDAPGSLHRL